MKVEEAIFVLKKELDGIPSDIDKSAFEKAIDLAIKALRIVEVIEACFKQDSNLMMDYDDWVDVKEEAEND